MVLTYKPLHGLNPSYIKDRVSLYKPGQVLRSLGETFLGPATFTGAFGGHMGKGLLHCCFQTLELPPTGGQTDPIFAMCLQADEGLSFEASFPLVTGCLSEVSKCTIVPSCFVCVFGVTFVTIFWGVAFDLF